MFDFEIQVIRYVIYTPVECLEREFCLMYQLSIDFLLLLSKSYLIPMICFSLIKSFLIEFLVQILKFLILSSVNADKLLVFNMAIDKEYIDCTYAYYCTRLQYTVCIDIVDYLVIVDGCLTT